MSIKVSQPDHPLAKALLVNTARGPKMRATGVVTVRKADGTVSKSENTLRRERDGDAPDSRS